jgi:divalent metal cation (Fe/Co/Zn/Cd) transporter
MRFVFIGAGDGIAAGWALLLVAVEMDVQGLGALLKTTEAGPLALAVMAGGVGVTAGMLGIAWRVMVLLPDSE